MTFDALAEGMKGSPGEAAVGEVVKLYGDRKLMGIKNISTRRCGEIGRCLVGWGLYRLTIWRPCRQG